MKLHSLIFLATTLLVGSAAAATIPHAATTTATLTIPVGTVVGSVIDNVEYYRGIPYAQSPTGPLRLKPPVTLSTIGTVDATGVGPACPQVANVDSSPLFFEVLQNPSVVEALFFGSALGDVTEDCLTISVMRPQDTPSDAKLPVLFWMFGGGFQLGSGQPYNGSVLIPRAVAQGKPFILVSINYRIGGFGFLGGKEVLADGAANLGLLDQRMALEWVADNIAAFGGDPDAVTIWGESAGAMSVFDQLALYDGDNTYKGRPLFRGAIMNSGSTTPTEPVDGAKAQEIFDAVAEAANCSSVPSSEKLECLRQLDFETYANATTNVPSFMGYNALSLSYVPRPDGRVLTASPDILAKTGKYAAVPMIVGIQENEGNMFSLFQTNLTTKADLVSYLNDILFRGATRKEVEGLVDIYPSSSCNGASSSNETYPEFDRLSAILGDFVFILQRRIFLDTVPKSVPTWSYQAAYERGTPILGTYHVSDLPRSFSYTDRVSSAIQDLYISFAHSLDPNGGAAEDPDGYVTHWPKWREGRQLIEFGVNSTRLLTDDFRTPSFNYIRSHLDSLRT